MTMRTVKAIGMMLGVSALSAHACDNAAWIGGSHLSALLPVALLESVTTSMTVEEIVQRLGHPARDVGSGLYVLQWDAEDGRVFSVSGGDPCGKPLSLKWDRPVSTGDGEAIAVPADSDSIEPSVEHEDE